MVDDPRSVSREADSLRQNQREEALEPGAEVDRGAIYRKLRLIRRVDEEVARIYPTDKIKSPVHLSIGQESVSVGVCDAMRADDVVSGTYRSHAVYLAKGGELKSMIAELYGKHAGCACGKGGSMHLVDMRHYVLGSSAVVGTTIAIAVGYGLALKRQGLGRVIAAFFGDGATEEGVFHESLNFAALHRLPVLFVCENNFYAIHTPLSKRWATRRLCERVETYGIPARQVADADVFAIRKIAAEAFRSMRTGTAGPVFLECHTYRWREHVGPNEDYDAGYRGREELAPWQQRDQVEAAGSLLGASERRRIDAEIEAEIAAAFAFAESSAAPDIRELYTNVYAE
jgi:pyruvate dehydrogenase E1 component alpha subunit